MLSALSTGHQIGLATTGAVFIVFALISSFVLPSRYPNFPGRGRNWYLLLSFCFFAAMMGAVFVFGRSKPEAGASPGTTTIAPGDPAAGKTVFTTSGCAACHLFTPAGSTGKVGPDLDKLKQEAAGAGQPLDKFIATSITNPNAYIAPGFAKPSAMPALKLTPKQVADLVAFLSSGK
jgi:mono/diheme cytochrome c family protein